MNADTLHAVDTLYLRAFHQNLLGDIRQARISLKRRQMQAASLALAKELPPAVRRNYSEVAERLLPLLRASSRLLDDVETNVLPWQGAVPRTAAAAPKDTMEVIARLDAAEREILGVLNGVGDSLAGLALSIISWDDSAWLKVYAILRRLAERPCYDELPIDLHPQPFLMIEYASKQRPDANSWGKWPHYLVDEMLPIELLPLLDGVRLEMEVRGEGRASWQTQKVNTSTLL